MKAFTKHVLVGVTDRVVRGVSKPEKVFVTIKWDEKRLSITGVVGPWTNGDASGGCGQISLLKEVATPVKNIDLAKLASVWDRWHLNDMRAGCEHQRKNWDPSEKVELVTYKLTSDACVQQRKLKDAKEQELGEKGATFLNSPQELSLYNLKYETLHVPPGCEGFYEVSKRETKTAGWVRPDEHPKGLLCKPCEVCGYKYGSQWLYEEVPEDVLEFLNSLPETNELPAVWARD